MVSLAHTLQILIAAKDVTGDTFPKVGGKIAALVGVVTKLSKVLMLLKFAGGVALLPLKLLATVGVGLIAVLGTLTVGVVGLVASLATLPHALATGLMKLTEYAAELDLVRRAFLGIAGEGAPAMLKALRKVTAFMVEELDLLETHNKAYALWGKELTQKLPEMMGYLSKFAAATGDDVTRLTELAIRSIGRLSTRWLSFIGTMTTVEEVEARAAEMFDTTTEALTYQQKQAGMLNLVLERLAARTANLPEVMGTAAQMAAALRVQYKELYGDLTTFLLPVVRALYPLVMKLVLGFRQLISEGGALYKPIRTITATFVVLMEVLENLLDKILGLTTSGTSAIENFANKIISMGWKAFSWGAHMITNFAAGIIKGASIALIAAMNFISGLLAHWLGPGSPPLVASNIGLWGASAFTEFLKGFSMADFDVLEGIQAPLKRALDVLVDLERLTPIDAFNQFVGISADLTAAIDELNRTGNVSASMLERLSQVGGAYGDELAELFRRYSALHAATEAYAAAQERLKRATEAEDEATKKLSKEAREYNKLVRAGADPATLRSKLSEVEASYDALEAARLEAEEAEEAEERAREQLKLQREQVRLQERLLNQLIAMAEAQAAALKAAGVEEGMVIPPIEWPEVYPVPIDEAFEDLKNRIRAKFQELWDELSKIWEDSEAGKWVTRLQERWDTFRTDTLDPLLDDLETLWGLLQDVGEVEFGWFSEQWDKWVEFWDEQAPKILGWWDDWVAWWDEEAPKILEWWDDLKAWWEDFSWEELTADLAEKWEEVKVIVTEKLTEIGQSIIDKWEEIKADAEEKWEEIKQAVGTKVEELFDWMGLDMDEMLLRWEQIWDDVKLIAEEIWRRITEWVEKKVTLVYNSVMFWVNLLKAYWSAKWDAIKTKVTQIWNTVVWYVTEKVTHIYDKVKFWIGLLKTWWDKKWAAIKAKVIEIFGEVYEGVKKELEKVYGKVREKIIEITVWLDGKFGHFREVGERLIQGLGEGVGRMAGWLITRATNIVEDVLAAIKRALGIPGSTSSVGEGLGEALIQGLADGMDNLANLPTVSMERITKGLTASVNFGGIDPSFAGRPGGGAAGVVIHNHFGKDSIRSSKDVYELSKQIQRSLTLRGARTVV